MKKTQQALEVVQLDFNLIANAAKADDPKVLELRLEEANQHLTDLAKAAREEGVDQASARDAE